MLEFDHFLTYFHVIFSSWRAFGTLTEKVISIYKQAPENSTTEFYFKRLHIFLSREEIRVEFNKLSGNICQLHDFEWYKSDLSSYKWTNREIPYTEHNK